MLRELSHLLWQATGSDLSGLMTELDQVAALAGAGRVAVTAEAVQRGEVASSQCASTAAWVAQYAPSLASGGGAGQLAKCIEQLRRPILQPVRDAVLAGELPVPVALVVVSEFDKLRGRIIPEAEPLVLAGLVDIGVQDGAREVRQLRPRLLADHGAPGELQDEQDRAAAQVTLSHPRCVDDGVWEYQLRLDVEAKAILEAAIGPLSAPWHPGGARDARSAAQRRGQALIEVCRRVTAAAKAAGPFGGHPTTAGPNPVHPEPASGPAGRQATSTWGDPSADPASAATPSAPAWAGAACGPTTGPAVEDLDRDEVDLPAPDPELLDPEPLRAEPTDSRTIGSEAIGSKPIDEPAMDAQEIGTEPIDPCAIDAEKTGSEAIDPHGTDMEPFDAETMQAVLGGLVLQPHLF